MFVRDRRALGRRNNEFKKSCTTLVAHFRGIGADQRDESNGSPGFRNSAKAPTPQHTVRPKTLTFTIHYHLRALGTSPLVNLRRGSATTRQLLVS
jgi:hypothetical protein